MTAGFVVGAPESGAGKTTVTIGLMRAFRRRGLAVQPFKCGPDYIDPAFHAAATGRPSFNLDGWAMARGTLGALVANHPGDIAIAEGVMGLFDGVTAVGQTARGTTADLAALTGWPVVLVIDASGQAETAAAVALGLARYRDDIGTHRYLALYHLANADVPNGPAWKAAASSPWTDRLRPHFRDHVRILTGAYVRKP